jgi:hypothetical protein
MKAWTEPQIKSYEEAELLEKLGTKAQSGEIHSHHEQTT